MFPHISIGKDSQDQQCQMDIDGCDDMVQEDKVDSNKAKRQSVLFRELYHDGVVFH